MPRLVSWLVSVCLITIISSGVSCGSAKDGGVFRSLDGGETWQQKTFISQEGRRIRDIGSLDIETLAFHPADANIIYLGTQGSGLFITLDGGEQWVPSEITSGTVTSVAIDPIDPKIIYLAKDTEILKSVDEGLTWTTVYSDVKSATINAIAIDSFEHNRLYAATSAGTVIKSIDYGVNWDLRLQIEDAITEIAMAGHDTRIVYALTSEGQIYQTTNGGEMVNAQAENINSGWHSLLTAELKKIFDGSSHAYDLALDPNDTTVVFMVTKRGMMRGSNNGQSWEDVVTLFGFNDKQNQKIKNVTLVPGNSAEIFFTLGNTIHKSTDSGNTWKIIDTIPTSRAISGLVIDFQTPNVVYVGTDLIKQQRGLIKK